MIVLPLWMNYLKKYPIDYSYWMSVARLVGQVEAEVTLSDLVTYVSPGIEVGTEVAVVAVIVVVGGVLTVFHLSQSLEVPDGNGTFWVEEWKLERPSRFLPRYCNGFVDIYDHPNPVHSEIDLCPFLHLPLLELFVSQLFYFYLHLLFSPQNVIVY